MIKLFDNISVSKNNYNILNTSLASFPFSTFSFKNMHLLYNVRILVQVWYLNADVDNVVQLEDG
jgi:hypothetical protein